MSSRSLGHRAPLLWLALPLGAGIVAGRLCPLLPLAGVLGAGVLAAAAATALAWRRAAPTWAWPLALSLALGCGGLARFHLADQSNRAWEQLPPRELRASVRITRLFSGTAAARVSGLGILTAADGSAAELLGQTIYFSCQRRPDDPVPIRSAVLATRGLLSAVPADAPARSFDGYLLSSGVHFRIGRGRFLRSEQPPLAYYRLCDAALVRFNALLGLGIAAKRPALAALLRAMMLGQTRELSEDQHTVFMQSGTMHLFAISGLNIAVIAGVVQTLLALVRLPPWLRFAAGTPLLWLFVDITGAAPSAVRAFAMTTFFHGAQVLRRPANPLAALVGSATVVLLGSPLQLFSASFLMSYAIVLALLLLGLPLADAWAESTALWRDLPKPTWTRLQTMSDTAWRWTVTAVAIGIGTTLVSMITGVEFFRLLTPGALVANLLLIPAAMLVTVAGFASLLAGLVGFTPVAILCNHAAALVLLVIEWLVRASVHVPGAFVTAEFRAPWIAGATLALLLALLLAGYATHWRGRGGWWPPFLVAAAVLAFAVRYP